MGRSVATVPLLPSLIVSAGRFTFGPFVVAGAVIWMVIVARGLRQAWQPVRVG